MPAVVTSARNDDTPSAQLPQGRYPASPVIVWGVAVLAALTGLMLGIVIPTALPAHRTHGTADLANVGDSGPEKTGNE